MQYVRVTKLASSNPAPPGDPENGIHHPHDGYWLEGEMLLAPKIGRCFQVARDVRNGVHIQGLFTTSLVTKIRDLPDGWIVYTENSSYRVSVLSAPELMQ